MMQMQQDAVEKKTDTAAIGLVQAFLKQAKIALHSDNLEEARDLFEKALAVAGEHPERADTIRQALKGYSDQSPPDWEKAYGALGVLEALGLQNEDTRQWRRDFQLREADFYLGQKKLDESFNIFGTLMTKEQAPDDSDALKAKISGIVRRNLLEQARNHESDLLRLIIQRFTEIARPWLEPGDELSEWLETISGTLEAISQDVDRAEQESRRWKTIALILVVIALITPIVYYVAIWNIF
jgi:tetratricopeptide (TPR) repeat protein